MAATNALLGRILDAQTRNALLHGNDLWKAAEQINNLATHLQAVLIAADAAGERLLGAASTLHPDHCQPVDTSHRIDGQHVLLLSGTVAGPVGLAQTTAHLRARGAAQVHVAVLDGTTDIPGADSTITLTTSQ